MPCISTQINASLPSPPRSEIVASQTYVSCNLPHLGYTGGRGVGGLRPESREPRCERMNHDTATIRRGVTIGIADGAWRWAFKMGQCTAFWLRPHPQARKVMPH